MTLPDNRKIRKIRKDEDELLDSIWKELSGTADGFTPGEDDFRDIRRRIGAGRMRRRKTVAALSASGIAAALFLMTYLPLKMTSGDSVPDTPVAKLRSMGVSVSDEQVSLRMDNDISLALVDSAYFRTEDDPATSIVSSSGIEIEVGSERMLRLDVPAGKQFRLRLADGTSVWLNSGSSIEYPASFDGCSERTVSLSGEAYFDVTKDESRPFIVRLGNGESIRVLGTSFNVNAYPDNSANVTTLLSGRIAYRQETSDRDVLLLPDQQISVDRTDGRTEVQKVESSEAVSWRGKMICFDNEKLPDLAKRLSRMYGIEISVADHLSEYAFTGKISYDKGVDFITRLMKETSGITCEIKDGRIFLD